MPGQLGQRALLVRPLLVRRGGTARPLGLERLADPQVQPGPVRGGQLAVGVLAEQVMGEAIPAGCVAAQHAGPDRRGERLGRRLGLLSGHAGDDLGGEPRAGHGGGP